MKKILFSIMSITLVIAMLGGATLAWFTDEAVSNNNTFTAGTLKLGGNIEGQFQSGKFASITIENMQPGETYELAPIELKNMGTLPLKIYRISAANLIGDQELAGMLDVEVKFKGETVYIGKLSDLFIKSKGFFTKEQWLEPEAETSMLLIVTMNELADNSYQNKTFTCDLLLDAVQTNRTSIVLMDSLGNPLPGAEISYWNGSKWVTLGKTDTSGSINSIFPPKLTTTSVRVVYKGYSKTYNQNIQEQSHFVFGTAPVTIKLIGSNGQPIPGASATVLQAADYGDHGGSYIQLGNTDENGELKTELLPYSYFFKMYYNGVYTEGISYNIVETPEVIFQTGRVYSESNKCKWVYKLGGGATISFKQNMELLPMEYVFKYDDGTPNQIVKVEAGKEIIIP